jgi:hypothetical protein
VIHGQPIPILLFADSILGIQPYGWQCQVLLNYEASLLLDLFHPTLVHIPKNLRVHSRLTLRFASLRGFNWNARALRADYNCAPTEPRSVEDLTLRDICSWPAFLDIRHLLMEHLVPISVRCHDILIVIWVRIRLSDKCSVGSLSRWSAAATLALFRQVALRGTSHRRAFRRLRRWRWISRRASTLAGDGYADRAGSRDIPGLHRAYQRLRVLLKFSRDS